MKSRRFPVRSGGGPAARLAPAISPANAIPPPSWPAIVQLLPDGQLKALIYYHKSRSMVSGDFFCWTYVSNGLSQYGQKEVVFTIRRRASTEGEQEYPPEPLQWFKFLHSLSQEGKIVDNFQSTVFQAPSFLGRSDLNTILYSPAMIIENVPFPYLPRKRLHAIPLTVSEGEVAQYYGAMRVLSHLGYSERLFPFPPWVDRDRKSCITKADMVGTLRGKISFQRVLEVSIFKRGSEIVMYVPKRAERFIKEAIEETHPSNAFPLESFMFKHADSGMVWKNEYTQYRAYAAGTSTLRLNLGFLLFCPEQEEDSMMQDEDGYNFFLTNPTWMKIRAAIGEKKSLTISLIHGLKFCLEYPSHRIKEMKAVLAPRTTVQRWGQDTCGTCNITRKFEPPAILQTAEAELKHLISPAASAIKSTATKTTLEALEQDSQKGCDKCTLLYKGIKAQLPYCDGHETGMVYFSGDDMRLYCTIGVKLGSPPVLEFFSDEYEPCPWLTPQKSSQVSMATAADRSVKTVQNWLQECGKSHNSCAVVEATLLPNRILDLGADSRGMEDIYLQETHGETGVFGTLSHCWGSLQPLKTNNATLEARKAGIRFTELPKAFQNAVILFRKLKIRYLWIDSLCIIQDDEEDWQREAAAMPMIYENTRLTIAVPGAGDCNEGCFLGGPPTQHKQKIRWQGIGGKGDYPVYIRHSFEHIEICDANEKHSASKLLSRGGVHRERLLSPRVLYLGKTELMWKCKETYGCECGYRDHVLSADSRTTK